jgi:hypothetical protein
MPTPITSGSTQNPRKHMQECGFAVAGRPHHRQRLTTPNRDINPSQPDNLPVVLDEPASGQHSPLGSGGLEGTLESLRHVRTRRL